MVPKAQGMEHHTASDGDSAGFGDSRYPLRARVTTACVTDNTLLTLTPAHDKDSNGTKITRTAQHDHDKGLYYPSIVI